MISIRTRIVDKDLGYRRLMRAISRNRNGRDVRIGVFGSAEVEANATRQEFGYGVPERPFLRPWFDAYERRNAVALKSIALAAVFEDKSRDELLSEFGEKAANEIKDGIRSRRWPYKDNEESTIRKKGSRIPLIDTGEMLDHIDYKIGEP